MTSGPTIAGSARSIAALKPPRLAAFTATATPEVRADIALQLGMRRARAARARLRSPEPVLRRAEGRRHRGQGASSSIDLVRMRDGGVALVYAATRKNAEAYAQALKKAGMRARVYHAGLEDNVREKAQDVFMAGKLDVIVATNAFGMGVDKSDIRLVVHADIPRSPEAYYQEAGRGGRDGKPTRCVLLFNHGDIRLQEFLIDASYPSAEMLRGLWKLLAERPQLGVVGDEDELEAAAQAAPARRCRRRPRSARRCGSSSGTACSRAIEDVVAARRPAPGQFAPLDVEALARRAESERSKLRTMVEYAYHPRCRRQHVLDYFGDEDWRDRATPLRRV